MARGCTFIDDIQTLPLTGANMRFHVETAGEIQCFNMERATAAKVAYDILREIERADIAELGIVVPFERAG